MIAPSAEIEASHLGGRPTAGEEFAAMDRRENVPGCRRGCGTSPGGRCSTALAAALLTALAAGGAAAQPGGLFREVVPAGAVAGPGLSGASDSITLRRRLVAIDFGQLAPPPAAAAVPGGAVSAPSGVLTLNLFDDASFTGLVQSVAPTFSGGYSLSGPLAEVEMGTMNLVVNGEVVAGTVRTPLATYRIRPAGGGSARRHRNRPVAAAAVGRADSPPGVGGGAPADRTRRQARGAALSVGRAVPPSGASM